MGYLGFREEHSLAKMLPIRAVAHRPPDRGHGVCMDLTGIVYVFLATIYTGSPKAIFHDSSVHVRTIVLVRV